MSKMIQIRNVPERLHRELTRRAANRRQSLADYVREMLEREVRRPSPEEVFERIRRRKPIDIGMPAAHLIREERRRAAKK